MTLGIIEGGQGVESFRVPAGITPYRLRNPCNINGGGADGKKLPAAKGRPPAQVEIAKLHNLRLNQ
jgi:hypothetical protein